ncbi:MAG: nucleoside-diphosphate kinase, partial [Rhodobacteraceae bacterium]|nr:nucleoside-diphosphate kinase [Paracoccaceae bacterium]
MVTERTLSIIKPDVTRRSLCGQVLARLEGAGLRVIALKRVHLTMSQARQFYAVHSQRPFFDELCRFMVSG